MRLSEAINALAIATRAEGRSPRTIQAYQEKTSYLLAFLGDVEIERVTLSDLRRYAAHLWDRGLSPFTVSGRVRHLKRLFNFAQEEGILTENPARRIKVPSPKRDKPKGIQWDDFIALLGITEGGDPLDVQDRALILLLFDTAARVGGLCGLQVNDLDLERRRALVTEKGNKTRFVFFQDTTAQALAAWLDVRPEDKGPWVFVGLTARSRGKMDAHSVGKMLKRRGKQAGCKGPINPHSFRHGFARHFLSSKGNLAILSRILGHSSVAVTVDFYGVFTVDELQAQHDQFSPIANLESSKNDD
jgi:site-specific recombinase XerD